MSSETRSGGGGARRERLKALELDRARIQNRVETELMVLQDPPGPHELDVVDGLIIEIGPDDVGADVREVWDGHYDEDDEVPRIAEVRWWNSMTNEDRQDWHTFDGQVNAAVRASYEKRMKKLRRKGEHAEADRMERCDPCDPVENPGFAEAESGHRRRLLGLSSIDRQRNEDRERLRRENLDFID